MNGSVLRVHVATLAQKSGVSVLVLDKETGDVDLFTTDNNLMKENQESQRISRKKKEMKRKEIQRKKEEREKGEEKRERKSCRQKEQRGKRGKFSGFKKKNTYNLLSIKDLLGHNGSQSSEHMPTGVNHDSLKKKSTHKKQQRKHLKKSKRKRERSKKRNRKKKEKENTLPFLTFSSQRERETERRKERGKTFSNILPDGGRERGKRRKRV